MSKSFQINVSGGNVSLGAAAQGDRSSVSGTSSMSVTVEAASAQLHQALADLALRSGAGAEALASVREQATGLVEASKAQETSKAASILELVQKNFSWAYPALKDFAAAAWPALLLAIGS